MSDWFSIRSIRYTGLCRGTRYTSVLRTPVYLRTLSVHLPYTCRTDLRNPCIPAVQTSVYHRLYVNPWVKAPAPQSTTSEQYWPFPLIMPEDTEHQKNQT